MASIVFECAVNKSHAKTTLPTEPARPPLCCGKPMIKVQAVASGQAAAVPKPAAPAPAPKVATSPQAAAPTTAASRSAPTAQPPSSVPPTAQKK